MEETNLDTKTTVISREALQAQEAICQEIRDLWAARGITPRAYVDTYGCQQNEADSEKIRGMLSASSSTPAPSASTPSSGSTETWARWCTPSAATRGRRFSSAGA